jgi:hypothetical protein
VTNQRTWTIGGVTYTADLEAKARRLRNAFDPEQPRDRKGRWTETGASVSIWGGGTGTVARNLGRISGVSPAGPPEDADTKPGSGWAVSFVDNINRHWTMYTTDDAVARVVPDEDFARLVEAERLNDQEQADRIAREIRDQVNAIDETEASSQPEAAPLAEVPAVDSRVRLSNEPQVRKALGQRGQEHAELSGRRAICAP